MPSFISKLIAWLSRKRAAPEEQTRIERVSIFIDGSNFYNFLKAVTVKDIGPLGKNKVYSLDALKERYLFGRGARFDFKLFVDDLVGDRNCIAKSFYTSNFSFDDRTPEFERVKHAKQRFKDMLKYKGFIVCEGEVIRDGQKQFEKGVDILLAMDAVGGAIEDCFDVAIIVSSDNDFLPLFKRIKKYGKKVEYIGFDHQYSRQLVNAADSTLLLTPERLEKYLLKK
jgi:uncharacterized LabA/DUF88 family protein